MDKSPQQHGRRSRAPTASAYCGPRYGREDGRRGHRWGQAAGKLGFHGGKLPIERPRVRARNGGELALPSWEEAQAEDWLGAMGHEPDADQRLDALIHLRLLCANCGSRDFGISVTGIIGSGGKGAEPFPNASEIMQKLSSLPPR